MRFPVMLVALLLVGCGPEAVCGEDDDGNPYPVCPYELGKDDLGEQIVIEYCPGDEWGSIDKCNSCACDSNGKILCTEITCPE